MDEAEAVGVQGLAAELLHGFFHRIGAGVARVAIHGVGGKRVFGFAHVHADLVGAAGFEGAFDVAVALVAFEHFDVGHGFFAAEADHGHFEAVVRVAADEGVDFAVERHDAVGHGAVDALHAALLQLLHEAVLRGRGFGHRHQAAGVFVEAVHDAGAGEFGQCRAVGQQAVEQGAAPVAGGGVDDEAGGFVQHNHAVVFKHNIQRHGLGREGGGFVAVLDVHFQGFAADESLFGAGNLAVEQHVAVFNPSAQAAAGIIGQQFGQRGIESLAGQIGGHG